MMILWMENSHFISGDHELICTKILMICWENGTTLDIHSRMSVIHVLLHFIYLFCLLFYFQTDAGNWSISDIGHSTSFIHSARALGPHRSSRRSTGSTWFTVRIRCRWNRKGLYHNSRIRHFIDNALFRHFMISASLTISIA